MGNVEAAAIEIAAEWWADKLRTCKHSGLSREERNDRSNDGYQMAEMLMTLIKPKVTDEQIDLFKKALKSRIEDGKERFLGVDYGPCTPLRESLEVAGINPGMGTLPIKTSMWLDGNKVTVRYGYGAEEQQIWPKVDEKAREV